MLPLPMNEYLQQALAECYFDVQLDVIEWNTLFTNWRRGAKDPSANGSNATNVTYAAMDPFFALVRFLQSGMARSRRHPLPHRSPPLPQGERVHRFTLPASRHDRDRREVDEPALRLHKALDPAIRSPRDGRCCRK
jgi:hypothetical protein